MSRGKYKKQHIFVCFIGENLNGIRTQPSINAEHFVGKRTLHGTPYHELFMWYLQDVESFVTTLELKQVLQ